MNLIFLQNLNGRSVLDNIYFEKDSRAEKDAVQQKVLSLKDDGQKHKMLVKIEFTPLTHCNIFNFTLF